MKHVINLLMRLWVQTVLMAVAGVAWLVYMSQASEPEIITSPWKGVVMVDSACIVSPPAIMSDDVMTWCYDQGAVDYFLNTR